MVFPIATHGTDSSPNGLSQDLYVEPREIATQLLQSMPCQRVQAPSAPLSTEAKCSLSESEGAYKELTKQASQDAGNGQKDS